MKQQFSDRNDSLIKQKAQSQLKIKLASKPLHFLSGRMLQHELEKKKSSAPCEEYDPRRDIYYMFGSKKSISKRSFSKSPDMTGNPPAYLEEPPINIPRPEVRKQSTSHFNIRKVNIINPLIKTANQTRVRF